MPQLGETLSHALVTAVVLLPVATVAAFVIGRRGRAAAPVAAPPSRVVAAGVLVALAALAVGALTGHRAGPSALVAAGLGASVPAWRRLGSDWAARGLVLWALTVDAGALYLLVVLHWTLTASVGLVGLVASGLLLVLESFVFLLALGYVWEMVDVLARRRWPRAAEPPGAAAGYEPFVSLHVPAHNEPPEMVIATLERLLALDYDAYEVVMVDDNTTDPALWRPVEEFCTRHERIRFAHLEDWPGYKSGALNYALTATDPRAELVGVVDADYLVEPDFLRRCTAWFADERLAFVQTPQDYRDWEQSSYFRRLYHSYDYFFSVSQRSRNERNGAIFGGTMGLIRRSALEEVGGWDQWCITEDAELSLRLLRAGWHGRHVQETYGRGLMPLTFEALKRQRFRWCFGGVQILRMHGRSLLPFVGGEDNRLTLGQRWAYLVGGLQWFGDLAGLLFTVFLLAGALDLVAGDGQVVRRVAGLVLACVAVLVVLGALRSVALVRRAGGASWAEALGAFGLWLALGWTVAQASVRGLVAREGAFLRTPKVRGALGWRDALRGNRTETALALVCLGVAVVVAVAHPGPASAVLGVLLAVQGAGHAAAPVNSLAAIRADLTPEQARRRLVRPSWARLGTAGRRTVVLGPLVAAAGVGAVLVLYAAPTGTPLPGAVDGALPPPSARDDRTPGPSQAGGSERTPGPTGSSTPSVVPTPTPAGPTRRPTGTAGPTQAPTRAGNAPTQAAGPTSRATPTKSTPRRGGGRPTSKPAPGNGGGH